MMITISSAQINNIWILKYLAPWSCFCNIKYILYNNGVCLSISRHTLVSVCTSTVNSLSQEWRNVSAIRARTHRKSVPDLKSTKIFIGDTLQIDIFSFLLIQWSIHKTWKHGKKWISPWFFKVAHKVPKLLLFNQHFPQLWLDDNEWC